MLIVVNDTRAFDDALGSPGNLFLMRVGIPLTLQSMTHRLAQTIIFLEV
jgi:hypothetical protein